MNIKGDFLSTIVFFKWGKMAVLEKWGNDSTCIFVMENGGNDSTGKIGNYSTGRWVGLQYWKKVVEYFKCLFKSGI